MKEEFEESEQTSFGFLHSSIVIRQSSFVIQHSTSLIRYLGEVLPNILSTLITSE